VLIIIILLLPDPQITFLTGFLFLKAETEREKTESELPEMSNLRSTAWRADRWT